MKKLANMILYITLSSFIVGCVASKTSASIPNFKQEYEAKKRIVVVPPLVKMYEISTGGLEEEMTQWSTIAKNNLQNSILNTLSQNNFLKYEFVDYSSLSEIEKESILSSQNLMYRISPSINSHSLNISQSKFNEKLKNFDYSIGNSLSNISQDGDLYLFVNAYDKVQSSGKKAAEAVKVIVSALLFGVGTADFGGITYSSISLVDAKTGKIMWYNYYFSKGQVDLRDKKGTDEVVKVLLDDLQSKI